MTCQELMLVIDAFVDDELSVMENLRVQAHLVFCHACRGTVESEVRLRGLIEADARAEVTPPHLRDRILRLADEQAPPGPSPGGRRALSRARRFRVGALAGGAMLTVALGAVAYLAKAPSPALSPVAAEVFGKHWLYSGSGGVLQMATQDPSELGPWLGGRVGFAVKLPVLARPGERLLGGRLSSVADMPAAYLLYERDGRRISLFIFRGLPHPSLPEPSVTVESVKFYTASVQGRPVVWWEEGDVHYAAASDGDLKDLIEFGLLCVKGRPSGSGDTGRSRRAHGIGRGGRG